jgi:hypothetical protein
MGKEMLPLLVTAVLVQAPHHHLSNSGQRRYEMAVDPAAKPAAAAVPDASSVTSIAGLQAQQQAVFQQQIAMSAVETQATANSTMASMAASAGKSAAQVSNS